MTDQERIARLLATLELSQIKYSATVAAAVDLLKEHGNVDPFPELMERAEENLMTVRFH